MKAEPARNGYTKTVDRLLENGGFADAADNHKRTPLSWAAANSSSSTTQTQVAKSRR